MSETRGSNKGSVNLDLALREWPEVEKPEGDWDDRAHSVLERAQRGERGVTSEYVTDEKLLDAPLGQSSEDGHNSAAPGGSPVTHPLKREGTPMTMPADRERDRRSLQDLAKMAHGLTPPPSSVAPAPSGIQRAVESAQSTKADDSGIVDLAAASTADPGAAARAQATPLASQGLFDEEPHSQRAAPLSHAPVTAPLGAQGHAQPAQPAPSLPPMAPSVPPPSLAPQHALTPSAPPVGFAPAALQTQPPQKKKGGAVIALVIGGVVALSAAAAGGVLFLKSRANVETAATPTVATAEPAVVAQAEPPAPAEATPAPVAEAEPEPTPEADSVTPPTNAPHGKVAMAAKPSAKGGAKHEATPAPAKAEGPAKMTEKDLVAAPSGPGGDLGAAMKKEVGDDAPKTPAAATTGGSAPTGNVPQKPSQGAVTGALGAVLPGARACLGPDDPISRASVVFSSAGSVQSVNVSGGAAGKPAEACIKGALMKAKVQPFAEPTYTANITVRHN
ncbi:MAG: hypothetical protein KF764_32285 [Labilithrix sp.]|nr:hypothetical protein [Labilithrix sp.]